MSRKDAIMIRARMRRTCIVRRGGNHYHDNAYADAAEKTHFAAVEDLRYSEPYRDDVDYDACHPGPSCSGKKAGSQCEAQNSEYDDYVRECDGSCAHSCKTRGTSKEESKPPAAATIAIITIPMGRLGFDWDDPILISS